MSKKIQRGLGKGIGALLGVDNINTVRQPIGYINKEIAGDNVNPGYTDVLRIPIDLIEPNPFQPRKTFSQEALDELAESIKSLGIIQPITVRKMPGGKYQIISGERRYRASLAAGLDMLPAYVRQTDEQGMLEMAIVENIQREDLDPIETAMSYQRLLDECELTQEEMAERIGKKRASITNYLRLLKLPAKLQHDLKVGLISVGHAKVLLGVEDPNLQEELCDYTIKHSLSVRGLEDKLRDIQNEAIKPQRRSQELPDEYYRVLEYMGKYFPRNISLKRSSEGKGTMTIRFSSDEEMRNFLQAIEKANL